MVQPIRDNYLKCHGTVKCEPACSVVRKAGYRGMNLPQLLQGDYIHKQCRRYFVRGFKTDGFFVFKKTYFHSDVLQTDLETR